MEVRKEKDLLTVVLSGELDHHCAAKIREQLDRELEDERISRIIFDFDGVTFMDSSGIGMLMGRYKTVKGRGGSVQCKNVSSRVDKILEMAGLYKIMQKI